MCPAPPHMDALAGPSKLAPISPHPVDYTSWHQHPFKVAFALGDPATYTSKPRIVLTGPYSWLYQGPAMHISAPTTVTEWHLSQLGLELALPISTPAEISACNRRVHTANTGVPLEHLDLVIRGNYTTGPHRHLLHKATPSRLEEVAKIPNT